MATTLRTDPVRNFKFNVQVTHNNPTFGNKIFAKMGFMSVEGMAMNTEMVPYREGGWNTAPHKLPGQTDFSPLTMSSGVFYDKEDMWNLAKNMFAVQWGDGTLGFATDGLMHDENFRYTMTVRVMGHPLTKKPEAGSDPNAPYAGAVLAFKFYNCWTASVGFNGLNAMDNAILIHQMTVHHEGFDVLFGNIKAKGA